ncbi:hypothetical protein FBZ99_105262 [Rhizobium sp. ERR 1071]|nr:hypothetical protein FBZ99_105262 [Rhizobium sp. ERR1071]
MNINGVLESGIPAPASDIVSDGGDITPLVAR